MHVQPDPGQKSWGSGASTNQHSLPANGVLNWGRKTCSDPPHRCHPPRHVRDKLLSDVDMMNQAMKTARVANEHK
jgi:hypothetical protein